MVLFGNMKSHQATAQDMWSEQNGTKSSSPIYVSSLSQAFVAGDPESGRAPGAAQCCRGEARAGSCGLSCRKHHVSCSLDTSRLAPTSKGLLFLLIHKAILFYQKFGLIYIHTHIYQHFYLYNASTVLGILQPQHTPFLSTSFG